MAGAAAIAGLTTKRTSCSGSVPPSDLFQNYFKFFRLDIAKTPEQQAEAHRIRYQVYCVETEFLPAEDNPGGLECDEHDVHSAQALLVHRASGLTAGTVRLVYPDAGQPCFGLPAAQASLALQQLGDDLPLDRTGEISRFSIARSFRRRIDDNLLPGVYEVGAARSPGSVRRLIPYMTIGLLQSIFEMALERDLTHLCAVIDPALLRLLDRFGITFRSHGAPIEFHGLRQPVSARMADIKVRLERDFPDVYEIITDRGRLVLPNS